MAEATPTLDDEKNEGNGDNPLFEEDYVSLWQRTNHGSIDLDEKLSSMTGSYSEILDDNHETDPDCENTLICDDPSTSHMQHFTSDEDRRTDACFKALGSATGLKPSRDETLSSPGGMWYDGSQEDSICELIRDFSEKNIGPRRKDNFGVKSSIPSVGLLNRTYLYPPLPPIDPTLIGDLEERARDVATSMDTLIENLTGTLHSISALSVDCVETYRDAVCKTCDAVDSNIKSMYQLMAKCEELSKSMKSVYKLHDEIKEIRRLLDLFEGAVFSSSGVGGGGGGT